MKALMRYLALTLLTVLVLPGAVLADERQRGGVGIVDLSLIHI